MAERLKLLIEEKICQLQNDLDKKKIEAKTMAEFAVVFYEKYGENYNEKLLVQLCKRTMNFYNEGLKNLPDEKKEFILTKISNGVDKVQGKIKNLLGDFDSVEDGDFKNNNFDIEAMENKYKFLLKELENIGEKKPFFGRKKWKRGLEKINQKLNRIKLEIKNCIEQEKNSEKNKELNESFRIIMEDLKAFNLEVNPEIGVELASITYEEAMKNQNQLRSYVYEIVIANLYKYFITKTY